MLKNIVFILCCFSLIYCKANRPDDGSSEVKPVIFTLIPEISYQTIHGFGASDAWACQFVGANWPDQKRNQIADWLFSSENDDNGNPKGIGLSQWRFNIGGGSTEQAGESDIQDPWRRAECFLSADQQYDWTKQAGQRWFLQAAKERGVDEFIAFVNSPPVTLTRNGKAYSSSSSQYNLAEENYSAYVDFLSNVLVHFRGEEGILFQYISPFNEPQWDWTSPGQEGTPAQNSEIAAVTRLLNVRLEEQNSDTKIEVPEAGKIEYLVESSDKTGRGNQVEDFFASGSPDYIGNLSHVAQKLAGHSYFSTWDFDDMAIAREQLVQKIHAVNPALEYWMTEYCLLEDNEKIKGSGRDLGMAPALYMARVIHADLTHAGASSWQWWTAISAYDYKDGLIYVDKKENNGKLSGSKMLWVLGNYSRFIRPGMERIAVDTANPENEKLDFSAYKSDTDQQLVFVVQNYSSIEFAFKLQVGHSVNYRLKAYLTSSGADDNLRLICSGSVDESLTIPGNSVMTVVLDKK